MEIKSMLNRLARSRQDRVVAGVCAGFAQTTETPVWMWRVAFIMGCIGGGAGVVLYLLLWYFMPVRNET
jgi:phage shock protein PspC (stress-responsive transcriptional regulator)